MRLGLTARLCRSLAKVAICAFLVTSTTTAEAQIGVTKSQADWIVVAIVAIGAGVGIGVYIAFHHGHSLKGCAVSGPGGLELQNKGDGQTYALQGEVAAIKPGEQVRVSGKPEKKTAGASPQFIVEKLNKDYGSCKVVPAAT
jgi:hypothetical protein